jgi:hypothetical protein
MISKFSTFFNSMSICLEKINFILFFYSSINFLQEHVDYQYLLLYFHLYSFELNTYLVHKHPLLAFEEIELELFQYLDLIFLKRNKIYFLSKEIKY